MVHEHFCLLFTNRDQQNMLLNDQKHMHTTVKPVKKGHSKIDKNKGLNDNW